MKRLIPALAALGLLLATTTSAQADVIFNSLNNGNYGSGGYLSSNNDPAAGGSFETAQSFPLAASYTLSSITIPLTIPTGETNEVEIRLWSSQGGLPKTVLESWDVKNQMGISSYNLVTVNSVLHPLLQAGGLYFVDVEAPDNNQVLYYPASTLTNNITLVESYDLGNTWAQLGSGLGFGEAFEVQGTLVPGSTPEPASLTVLGIGALGLAGYSWRRKRKCRAEQGRNEG